MIRKYGNSISPYRKGTSFYITILDPTDLLKCSANDSAKIARKKRLLYRSRQRGWLEVDLLLGSWTQKNIDGLQEGELNDFEAILNQETIDIYNYITKQRPIPSELDTNVLHRLQEYCANSPLGKASMDGYTHNKRFMSN